MQGRGQARRDEIHAAGTARIPHLQGQAQQGCLRIDADALHQRQGLAVGAQQDVLAVVEHLAVERDAARAAAQGTAGFEQRHGAPAPRQLHGGRTASPARADDGDGAASS